MRAVCCRGVLMRAVCCRGSVNEGCVLQRVLMMAVCCRTSGSLTV